MPLSVVGGVGVILNMYNLSDLLKGRDVKEAMVKSGQNIDMGSILHDEDEKPDSAISYKAWPIGIMRGSKK